MENLHKQIFDYLEKIIIQNKTELDNYDIANDLYYITLEYISNENRKRVN